MTKETDFMKNKVNERGEDRVGADIGMISEHIRPRAIKVLKDVMSIDPTAKGDRGDLEGRNLPIRVAWINRTPGGYRVALVGAKYAPETVDGDDEEISNLFKDVLPDISSMLLRSDDLFIDNSRKTVDPIVVEDTFAVPELIVNDGEYTVMSESNSLYKGYIFNNVVDFGGKTVGARIWSDGKRFAFQDAIAGDEARDVFPTKIDSEPHTGSWGTFGFLDDGKLKLFLPFNIKGVTRAGGRSTIQGHTVFGNDISIIMTPGISKPLLASGIRNDEIGELLNANIYYLPTSYRFFGLGTERVDLIEVPGDLRRRQMKVYLQKEPGGAPVSDDHRGRNMWPHGTPECNNFSVSHLGDGCYAMCGNVLDCFGGKEINDVPFNRSVWTLMNLGFSEGGARYVLNRAQALGKINVAGAKKPEV